MLSTKHERAFAFHAPDLTIRSRESFYFHLLVEKLISRAQITATQRVTQPTRNNRNSTAYRTRWARMCGERRLRRHRRCRCRCRLPGLLKELLPRYDGCLPGPQLHREQLPPARRHSFRDRGRSGGRLLRSESGRCRGRGRRRRRRNPSCCGGRGSGGGGGGGHGVFHGETGRIWNSRGHGIRSRGLGF